MQKLVAQNSVQNVFPSSGNNISVKCRESFKEQCATFNWNTKADARLKYTCGQSLDAVASHLKSLPSKYSTTFRLTTSSNFVKTPSEWHFANSNCIFPGKNRSEYFKTESRIEDSFWICDSLKVNSFYENPLSCRSQQDDPKVIDDENDSKTKWKIVSTGFFKISVHSNMMFLEYLSWFVCAAVHFEATTRFGTILLNSERVHFPALRHPLNLKWVK